MFWPKEPSTEDRLSRAEAGRRDFCGSRVEVLKWKKAQVSKQRLELGVGGGGEERVWGLDFQAKLESSFRGYCNSAAPLCLFPGQTTFPL